MLKIHEEAHRSAKVILQRSRSKVWVVKGKSLADKVEKACIKCKARKAMKVTLSPVTDNQDLLSGTSTSMPGAQRFKDAVNLQVGDVCLFKYDSKIKVIYRLCIIKKVFPDDWGGLHRGQLC